MSNLCILFVFLTGIGHVHVTSNRTEAVLDSVIGFKANYSTLSNSGSDSEKYMWTWCNNADKTRRKVYSNNTYYLITKVFSSGHVTGGPGNYNMTVEIFNNSAKQFIPRMASGYSNFYLTGKTFKKTKWSWKDRFFC